MQVILRPRNFFLASKSEEFSGLQSSSLWIMFGKGERKNLLHIVLNEFQAGQAPKT